MARIILRFENPGDVPQVYTDDPSLEVLTISEFAPADRVYQLTQISRVSPETLNHIIGGNRVGRLGDMPGAEARVRRLLAGEPEPKRGAHLSVVEPSA